MALDLAQELISALCSPAGAAAIAAAVGPTVDALLQQRLAELGQADNLGGLRELATWLGCPSSDAARKRVERDVEMAALAVVVGCQRRWRRREIEALLTKRRGGG